jgi:prepilin-type N-terminal cleavage/methylation domain-containing protein
MKTRTDSGFTLIELLIVAGIVPVVSVALFGLIIGLRQSHDHLQARYEAQEQAARVLRVWKGDVSLASGISVALDGRSMALGRLDDGGDKASVRYELTGGGDLLRILDPSRGASGATEQIICRDVRDLEFSPVGRGCRLSWRLEYTDGVRRMNWTFGGFATPLAFEEGQES